MVSVAVSEKLELLESRKKAADLSLGSSHQLIYQQAVDVFKKYIPQNAVVFDFGAGQGNFLKFILSQELENEISELRGIDLMSRPKNLDPSVHWTQWDLNDEVPAHIKQADCIASLEVIEHLENPRQFMRQLYKLLKPGGYLLLSTPNNESYRSLLSLWRRGHFVEFTGASYPAHITALTLTDLRRISKEAGFHVEEIFFLKQGGVPGWPRISWQKLSFGLLKGLRFSDNVFFLLRK